MGHLPFLLIASDAGAFMTGSLLALDAGHLFRSAGQLHYNALQALLQGLVLR